MVHLFRKLGIEVGDYVKVVDILKLSAFHNDKDIFNNIIFKVEKKRELSRGYYVVFLRQITGRNILGNDDLLCIYGAKLEKLNGEDVMIKII